MKRVAKNSNRIVPLGLSLAMIVGLSACASTNVVKMTEAAPITYKLGQGGAKYASLSLPKSSRPSLPSTRPQARPQRLAEPEPYALPTAPIPHSPSVTVPSGPQFNPGDVDTRLYAHQKVGQRYTIKGKSYTPKHDPSYDNVGIASWYGKKFHGRKTATGEIYNMNDMTAAHKTLPLNSMVHVENLENGRTLIVRVNDRGPFAEGRIIDLSKASAEALGTLSGGLARVRVRYIGPADPNAAGGPIALPPVLQDVPVIQDPQPEIFEDMVEAPSYAKPTPPQQVVPAVPQEYFDVPRTPNTNAPSFDPIAPRAPVPAPMADVAPEDSGQVTLTIKGPIHIAKHDKKKEQARLIKGAHQTSYTPRR